MVKIDTNHLGIQRIHVKDITINISPAARSFDARESLNKQAVLIQDRIDELKREIKTINKAKRYFI